MITITNKGRRPDQGDGLPAVCPKWVPSIDIAWTWAQAYVHEAYRFNGCWDYRFLVEYPGGAFYVTRKPC